MPFELAATPRKMLPPPITSAISTPRPCTSMSSSAICDSVPGSMACSVEPIKASPESLSRMRRYFTPGASGSLLSRSVAPDALARGRRGGAAGVAGAPFPFPVRACWLFPVPLAAMPGTLRLSGLLLDLGHEVVGALLEALADLEADEAADLHVLARLGHEIGEQRADVLLALGVLHPDLVEEAYLLGPLGELAVDDLPPHRLGLAGGLGLLEADRLLLLEDGRRDLLLRDVLRVERRDLHRDLLGEADEVGVAGHEVGLAVDLHHHADAAAVQVAGDGPLGGDAGRLLGGRGDPLLAEVLDRLLHVGGALAERLLAVGHAGARALAQVLDHLSGDFSSHDFPVFFRSLVGEKWVCEGRALTSGLPCLPAWRPLRASAARRGGARRPRRAALRRRTRRGSSEARRCRRPPRGRCAAGWRARARPSGPARRPRRSCRRTASANGWRRRSPGSGSR